MTEVSCLYQHLLSPSEGHLHDVYNIFRYLQKNISKNPGRKAVNTDCVPRYKKVFEGKVKRVGGLEGLLPRCRRCSSKE